MISLQHFINRLWNLLPAAGLSSEYHPATEGGAIPIPFIRSQKQFLEALQFSVNSVSTHPAPPPVLEKPRISYVCYLRKYNQLPLRERALASLRSAELSGAHHMQADLAKCALDVGLTASDIKLVVQGGAAPGWSYREKVMLHIIDEWYEEQFINDDNWQIMLTIYQPQQILDLMFTAASFHLCVYAH